MYKYLFTLFVRKILVIGSKQWAGFRQSDLQWVWDGRVCAGEDSSVYQPAWSSHWGDDCQGDAWILCTLSRCWQSLWYDSEQLVTSGMDSFFDEMGNWFISASCRFCRTCMFNWCIHHFIKFLLCWQICWPSFQGGRRWEISSPMPILTHSWRHELTVLDKSRIFVNVITWYMQ